MRDEMLSYFERELAHFRKNSQRFAQKYPKIASRLQLESDKCEDPHVERLIESFAYLTGRIRLKLDDEFPEITESFLNVLYPHYLAPIPSMSIIQMRPKPTQAYMMSGYVVERGREVTSQPVNGHRCTFRTCFDTVVWPLEVVSAGLETSGPLTLKGRMEACQIRIRLRCLNDTTLANLKTGKTETAESIKNLRFHINGDPQQVFPLYEILMNHCTGVELVAFEPPKSKVSAPLPISLPASALTPAGFAENEGMIPYSARSFPGYRLLTEYFTFPEKFLFFDVAGLNQAAAAKFGEEFEIRIHLKDVLPPPGIIDRNTFLIGCTPVVNLFEKAAEPIQLTHRKFEYHVLGDIGRRPETEIHSINRVETVDSRRREFKPFEPFYSYQHNLDRGAHRTYWYATRRPSQLKDDQGTEMFLTLVDLDFRPQDSSTETIVAQVTCTNRDLPAQMPFSGQDGEIEVEKASALILARCLRKFTPTVRPPMRRNTQWRLISHLALNHLSLVGDGQTDTPHALREILQMYDFSDSPTIRNQISGLTGISSRPLVRQVGPLVGTGFVRGIETQLEFDETQFVGSGVFLFASVLERFLGLYVSVNSFSQLAFKTKQREGVIRKWAPRTGNKILL